MVLSPSYWPLRAASRGQSLQTISAIQPTWIRVPAAAAAAVPAAVPAAAWSWRSSSASSRARWPAQSRADHRGLAWKRAGTCW